MLDNVLQPKAIHKLAENKGRFVRIGKLSSLELADYTGPIDIEYEGRGHATAYVKKGILNGEYVKYEKEDYGVPDAISAKGNYENGLPDGAWAFFRPISSVGGQSVEALTGYKAWMTVVFEYDKGKVVGHPTVVMFSQQGQTTIYSGTELKAPHNPQELLKNIPNTPAPKKVSKRRVKADQGRQRS